MCAWIVDLMQPEVVSIEEGRAEVRFPVPPEFTLQGGSLQGGMVGAMLDMGMAIAAKGTFSTASLHVDILRPPKGQVMTVRSRVVQAGRRIVFAEAEMLDPEGRVVAKGCQTAVPVKLDAPVSESPT